MSRIPTILIPAALAALAAAALPAASGSAVAGPTRCEITATASGSSVTLQPVVHTDRRVSGSYSFRVTSSGGGGSSNISQGGNFEAAPGKPATLGSVTLSRGAGYQATLDIDIPSGSIRCRRNGGSL